MGPVRPSGPALLDLRGLITGREGKWEYLKLQRKRDDTLDASGQREAVSHP